MKMFPLALIVPGIIGLSGCSTIDQSLELGATTGFASGALAVYAGHSAAGSKANLEQVAMGAGVGLGIGLLTSYLIHGSVEEDRERRSADQTELHFGDLPPSPFILPVTRKKGGQR